MEIKKLIAVDMDGTALPDDHGFTPFTREFFTKLNQQGYMIVLCSGRPFRAMKKYYEEIGCHGPIVCYNGGLVFHPHDKSFQELRYSFPYADIKAIFQEAKSFLTSFMYESPSEIHSMRKDDFLNHYFPEQGMSTSYGEPIPFIFPLCCISSASLTVSSDDVLWSQSLVTSLSMLSAGLII